MSIALDEMSDWARSAVNQLGLQAHPEGGWYARDWQSPLAYYSSRSASAGECTMDEPLAGEHTTRTGLDGRPLASLIYFLLPEGDASAWHKVDADELWLWHGPAPVTLELGGDGDAPAATPHNGLVAITLGRAIAGATAEAATSAPTGHAVVPAGVWQRTVPGRGDALVSCVVSPGFTFQGFTLE